MSEAVMAKKSMVYVGCDPEFFLKSTKDNRIVGAYDRIGGTKDAPVVVSSLNENYKHDSSLGNFAYQEDGAAFEFNIPATTQWDAAADYTRTMLKWSYNFLAARGFKPSFQPTAKLRPVDLNNPKASVIGCSADWDAYTERARRPFAATEFGDLRFAGGHLHLGYDKAKVPPHIMVQFIDAVLGLPAVFADKQGPRRKFYGQAGLYREKPYGVEYRTLSNFWLRDHDTSTHLNAVYGALADLGLTGTVRPDLLIDAYGIIPWDDVREAINTENEQLASTLIDFLTSKTKLPYRFGLELMSKDKRPVTPYKKKTQWLDPLGNAVPTPTMVTSPNT